MRQMILEILSDRNFRSALIDAWKEANTDQGRHSTELDLSLCLYKKRLEDEVTNKSLTKLSWLSSMSAIVFILLSLFIASIGFYPLIVLVTGTITFSIFITIFITVSTMKKEERYDPPGPAWIFLHELETLVRLRFPVLETKDSEIRENLTAAIRSLGSEFLELARVDNPQEFNLFRWARERAVKAAENKTRLDRDLGGNPSETDYELVVNVLKHFGLLKPDCDRSIFDEAYEKIRQRLDHSKDKVEGKKTTKV